MSDAAALFTPLELADLLRIGGNTDRARHRQVLLLANQHGWPRCTFGRAIRFTQEHVDDIVAQHSQSARPPLPAIAAAVALPGQTRKSAARS